MKTIYLVDVPSNNATGDHLSKNENDATNFVPLPFMFAFKLTAIRRVNSTNVFAYVRMACDR